MEEQQNLGELIKIRREKLAKLIEEGHNPFEVVRFDKDAYADAIKKGMPTTRARPWLWREEWCPNA